MASRSPYGERGLKSHDIDHGATQLGRSPYGERGLKYIRKLYCLLVGVALLTESVD